MARMQLHPDADPANAAPEMTTSLPRGTHRKSSPSSTSQPNGLDAAVKPAAAPASAAQDDHDMDEAKDSDSDSSVLSSSSEEPSSDEDSDDEASENEQDNMETEEITTLPLPPDAQARKKIYQQKAPPKSALSDRLKEFLPQLAAANESLERDRAAGKLAALSLENVDENAENYIEMNLGLGVLKERDPNKTESDSESDSGEESGDEMETDTDGQKEQEAKEQDVLAKLMGQKKSKSGAVIQEVTDQ